MTFFYAQVTKAQDISPEVAAIKQDNVTKLNSFVNPNNLNGCFQEGKFSYTLLAQAIRDNAKKCFDLLIEKGADVNKACEGYVPPIMPAAKYGRLEMLKILVAKGVDVSYQYEGDYEPANGETALMYAEKYKQIAVVDYLRSIKK